MGFTNTTVAGLKLWLKAGVGITQSGGTVSNWADQSGNGNDVLQASPGLQPAFTASSVNGLPGLTFASGTYLSAALDLMAVGHDRTIVAVIKAATGAGGTITAQRTGTTFNTSVDEVHIGGATLLYGDSLTVLLTDAATPRLTGSGQVWEWKAQVGSPPVVNLNAVTQTLGSFAGSNVTSDTGGTGTAIGVRGNHATWPFNGDICEILIYDSVLSSGDLQQVRAYLQTKYAISLGITALSISPPSPIVATGASQTFTGSNGSGAGYVYSINANNSGCSINSSTGVYTAGSTGSVTDTVRVTDSVGNTADAVVAVGLPTTGLKLWLTAGAGITLSGSNVTAWADQSGNGNNVTAPGLSCVLNTSSINGLPGITFNGSTSRMIGGPDLQGASHLFIVHQAASTPHSGFSLISMKGLSGPAWAELVVDFVSPGYQPYTFVNDLTSTTSAVGLATAVTTSPTIWESSYNGGTNSTPANYTGLINGAGTVVASNLLVRVGTDQPSIGARVDSGGSLVFPFHGDICEILIYDHVLSGADRAAVEAYLTTRYLASPLAITPTATTIPPLTSVFSITARGGNDGGNPANYVFSTFQNQSGGSLTDNGDGTAEWDAGPTDGTDIVRVTDLSSATADCTITVLTPPALSIAPTPVSLSPLATQLFTAAGGTGPYVFTIHTNNSGGSLVDHGNGTATYTVGATPSVTDFIRVTDSVAATADAEVDVGTYPPLTIAPTTATVSPLGSHTFVGSGGRGTRTYSLFVNNSGGSVNSSTGVYTAGSTPDCSDTVRVSDTFSGTADAVVTVGPGVSISPTSVTKAPLGTQTFTASGGSGTGYVFAFNDNQSGGSINSSTGAYIAGSVALDDVVTVTDSLGNSSVAESGDATVHIPPVAISPPSITLAPRAHHNFTAAGGSGTGITFSFVTNNSGGSIDSSGHYIAGATGGVTDAIQAIDSLGNTGACIITVGPNLSISPASVTKAPRASQTFSHAGGSGTGIVFSFVTNNSGGSLNTSTGAYTAGATGSVTDTVRVTDDLGNTANATITVGPNLTISPTTLDINVSRSHTFTDAGGSGTGITFSLVQNHSGGSINSSTGVYTAGTVSSTTDIVQVADDLGNTAQATIQVFPPPPTGFFIQGIKLIGLSTVRVQFSYPPQAVDPTAAADALHPANYTLSGNDVTYVIAALPVRGDAKSIDCLLAAPLSQGKWTLSGSNIMSADGSTTL